MQDLFSGLLHHLFMTFFFFLRYLCCAFKGWRTRIEDKLYLLMFLEQEKIETCCLRWLIYSEFLCESLTLKLFLPISFLNSNHVVNSQLLVFRWLASVSLRTASVQWEVPCSSDLSILPSSHHMKQGFQIKSHHLESKGA